MKESVDQSSASMTTEGGPPQLLIFPNNRSTFSKLRRSEELSDEEGSSLASAHTDSDGYSEQKNSDLKDQAYSL